MFRMRPDLNEIWSWMDSGPGAEGAHSDNTPPSTVSRDRGRLYVNHFHGSGHSLHSKASKRSGGAHHGQHDDPEMTIPLIRTEAATPTSNDEQQQFAYFMPGEYQYDRRYHASNRWQENLPLTADGAPAGDLDDQHTIITQTDKDDDNDEPTTIRGKIAKFVKILVPHVVLISMLLGYLSLGAIILTHMESPLETRKRRDKMEKLLNLYDKIANETWIIQGSPFTNHSIWSDQLKGFFLDLAEVHEGKRFKTQFKLYPDIHSKWTFPTALLYALTVLTTCGYGEVGVYTPGGQLFAVAFALVGIPLMFITAADIGKFLSESLMKLLDMTKACYQRIIRCFRPKKMASADGDGDDEDDDDEFYGAPPEQLQKLWFPIITYVSVISGYCAMGAVMFRTWETDWPFIHAFHFGFNLIVTVGLGEIVVTDPLFLCLIVAFVIVGLSVVTMCVDLASTHLKAYFTRIHYFGRARKFLDMSDDIRNMMEYLAWMRKKKGGQVTWQDVRDLMESIRLGPYNPREAARWRWIDETSSAYGPNRQSSYASDLMGGYHRRGQSRHSHRSTNHRMSRDLSPFAEESAVTSSRSGRSSSRTIRSADRKDDVSPELL